jgi:hypothetical protein
MLKYFQGEGNGIVIPRRDRAGRPGQNRKTGDVGGNLKNHDWLIKEPIRESLLSDEGACPRIKPCKAGDFDSREKKRVELHLHNKILARRLVDGRRRVSEKSRRGRSDGNGRDRFPVRRRVFRRRKKQAEGFQILFGLEFPMRDGGNE